MFRACENDGLSRVCERTALFAGADAWSALLSEGEKLFCRCAYACTSGQTERERFVIRRGKEARVANMLSQQPQCAARWMVYLILSQISRPPLCYFSIMYTHIPNKRQKCRSGKSMPPREGWRQVFVQIKGDAREADDYFPASEFVTSAAEWAKFVCHQEYAPSPRCLPLIFRLFGKLDRNLAAHKGKMTHTPDSSEEQLAAKFYGNINLSFKLFLKAVLREEDSDW